MAGSKISVFGTVENTTGKDLTFASYTDWIGSTVTQKIGPKEFSKVALGEKELESAVVFRGDFDWLVSWYVTSCGENHVYTEIQRPGYFESVDWNDYKGKLERAHNESIFNGQGYTAIVTIEPGSTTPNLSARIFPGTNN